MKRLYLIRHGEAEDKGRKRDFDRNLVKEGREAVLRTGMELKERNIVPDLIISSPANRAIHTATIVAETVGYAVSDIVEERDIYYTDVSALLEIIHRQEDTMGSILLAGHNPSISYLAGMLSHDFHDFLPTGGLMAFESDTDSWNSFEKGEVKVLFRIIP